MILFMWQDDISGDAHFIDACLERVSTSAGPPVGDRWYQASDQLQIHLLLHAILRILRVRGRNRNQVKQNHQGLQWQKRLSR